MLKEEWRDVSGFEDLYLVSNRGKVKSKRRGIVLSPSLGTKNYFQVVLCNKGVRKTKRVHTLVAESFIPNPNNLSQVNHIDEDKLNNLVSNLEWCTPRHNIRHSRARKVSKFLNGVKLKTYDAIVDTTLEGFHISSVVKCCRGERKTANGFNWKYEN